MSNRWVLFCSFIFLMASGVVAEVVLIVDANNVSISFRDMESKFAPSVKGSGECGTLFLAEPLDACSTLTNTSIEDSMYSPYLLIIRGGCSFEDKVRRAQSAGFKAAIIYNNEDSELVAMAGNSAGIKIHAVFVSQSSGLKLGKYVGIPAAEVWITPTYENSAWSIMAISFISLLAMSAVLATCFFVRRHRVRREHPRASRVREIHGMSSQLVKAMPSHIFTAVLEDNCTSSTCAICLEDYNVGDKLRILPCCHKFHTTCVDAWLTSWRTFCPVCKRDARTCTGEPPASERTPLLSSNPASVPSSVLSSSYASQAIPIGRPSPSVSNVHSVSWSSCHNQPSYSQSPYHPSPSSSRMSSVDIRNASSSLRSHMVSSHELGYPSLSPHNSRYMSSYYASPGNASSGYMWSSSQQQPHPLLHTESAASISPYASAHSLSSQQQPHPFRHTESAASFSPYTSAHSLPEC